MKNMMIDWHNVTALAKKLQRSPKMTDTTDHQEAAESGLLRRDLFSEVRPSGLLGRCLDAISNPRKHRWNAYLRACKRIPKDSPVYGSTSFEKINTRRHALIDEMFADAETKSEEIKRSPEYVAVTRATREWLCGPMVASNFLMGRLLRRLQTKISSEKEHL